MDAGRSIWYLPQIVQEAVITWAVVVIMGMEGKRRKKSKTRIRDHPVSAVDQHGELGETWGQACGRHTKVDAKVTKLWSLDDRNTRVIMHRCYALRRNSNKIRGH